jgi:hypothetical protein
MLNVMFHNLIIVTVVPIIIYVYQSKDLAKIRRFYLFLKFSA